MGCEIIDKPEKTPSFVSIQKISVATDYENQGSNSSEITEGWIFANGEQIGIFSLPALVPILKEGDVDLTILAGIKKNGISASRDRYPFYDDYETTVNLKPNDTTKLNPVINYFPSIFPWQEDFEDPGTQIESKGDSTNATIEVTTDPDLVFEGSGSGIVELTSEKSYFLGTSNSQLQLPVGSPVFLEMDYNTTIDFRVGIITHFNSPVAETILFIRPAKDSLGLITWQKIYIDLSERISANSNSAYTELFIEARLNESTQSARLLFDNLKIVHSK